MILCYLYWKLSALKLGHRSKIDTMLRWSSSKLRNIRLHVKTGGWNTPNPTTAKTSGCANGLPNTSSRAQVCSWNGAHPGLPKQNLLNYRRIENANEVHKKIFIFHCMAVKYTITGGTKQMWACLSCHTQSGWTANYWRSSNVSWYGDALISKRCTAGLAHAQACHNIKLHRKLVMHEKSATSSKLKWDSFEIWLRKSMRPLILFSDFPLFTRHVMFSLTGVCGAHLAQHTWSICSWLGYQPKIKSMQNKIFLDRL